MKGFFSDLEKLAEGVFDPKLLSWGCNFCQDHVQPLCSAEGSREGDEREEELSGAEGSGAGRYPSEQAKAKGPCVPILCDSHVSDGRVHLTSC